LIHSHCLVLGPATLAALPSTRAIPDRDVFCVAHPIRSILFILSKNFVISVGSVVNGATICI
jgi:hypothetical protein